MWFVVLGEINKTDLTWSGMKNSFEMLLKLHHSNGRSCIFFFFFVKDKMCHKSGQKSLVHQNEKAGEQCGKLFCSPSLCSLFGTNGSKNHNISENETLKWPFLQNMIINPNII